MLDNIPAQYFYCDKNNCKSFQDHIYGWGFIGDKFYANEDLQDISHINFQKDTINGCFAITKKNDNCLEIFSSPSSFGAIYVYKSPDSEWAISNSYHLLVEKIIERRLPLTLYEGFVGQALRGSSAITVESTMCNEIIMIPARSKAVVDFKNGAIALLHPEPVQSVSILTAEGMAIIDEWINTWIGLFVALERADVPITEDITGGYDSRLIFSLVLTAFKNKNKINYYCGHGIEEDDERCVTLLAKKTGITVENNIGNIKLITLDPVKDLAAMDYAHKYLVKSYSWHGMAAARNTIRITGFAGEILRDMSYWYENEYPAVLRRPVYGKELAEKAYSSYQKEIENVAISPHVQVATVPNNTYRLLHAISRTRWHFGAPIAGMFLKNIIALAPATDPSLQALDMRDAPDYELFYAVCMQRIYPEISDVPYCDNKNFSEETRNLATWLNKKYPFKLNPRHFDFTELASRPAFYQWQAYTGTQTYTEHATNEVKKNVASFNTRFNPIIAKYVLEKNKLAGNNLHVIRAAARIIDYEKNFSDGQLKTAH